MAEMPIERGKIREYAVATKNDCAEFMLDPRSHIPPTFLATVVFWDSVNDMIHTPEALVACDQAGVKADVTALLSLEQEYIFYGPPPRAGDVLYTSARFDNAELKVSSRNRMVLLHFAMEFRDGAGALQAECLYTSAYRTVLEPVA